MISRAPSRTYSRAACRCCSSRATKASAYASASVSGSRASTAGTPPRSHKCSTSTRQRSSSAGAGVSANMTDAFQRLLADYGMYGGGFIVAFLAGLFPFFSIEVFLVLVTSVVLPSVGQMMLCCLLAAVGHQL